MSIHSMDYRYKRWLQLGRRWAGVAAPKLTGNEFSEWHALSAELKKTCEKCDLVNGVLFRELDSLEQEIFLEENYLNGVCIHCGNIGLVLNEIEKKELNILEEV